MQPFAVSTSHGIFNSDKSHRDAKNCRYCNFQGFWNQLQIQKCFLRQSLTKYLETNLRNKVKQNLYEKFHGSFCQIFLRYCPIYIFRKETEDQIISTQFQKFSKITSFPNALSLKSFGKSRSNLYIQLLVIITKLHFRSGERKLWKTQHGITRFVKDWLWLVINFNQ